MTYESKALLSAAAVCAIVIAAPALAQDAPKSRHIKHAHAASVVDVLPETATAQIPDSPCRLEMYDTGVQWKSYQTMCGPR